MPDSMVPSFAPLNRDPFSMWGREDLEQESGEEAESAWQGFGGSVKTRGHCDSRS